MTFVHTLSYIPSLFGIPSPSYVFFSPFLDEYDDVHVYSGLYQEHPRHQRIHSPLFVRGNQKDNDRIV